MARNSKSKSRRSTTRHGLRHTSWDVKRDSMRVGRRLYGAEKGPETRNNYQR